MITLEKLRNALGRLKRKMGVARMTPVEKLRFAMAYVDVGDYPTIDEAYQAAVKADERAAADLALDCKGMEALDA